MLPLLYVLIISCQAIPQRVDKTIRELKFPPKLSPQGILELTKANFEGYLSLQEVCDDFHWKWWEKDKLFRLYMNDNLYDTPGSGLTGLRGLLPPPNLDPVVPVQVILARQGFGALDAPVPDNLVTRECTGGCEDTRSAVELYISWRLHYVQVRSKGIFRLLCPPGYLAVLEYVPDRRVLETPATERLLKEFMRVFPSFKGEKQFKSLQLHPRVQSGPVRTCNCVKETQTQTITHESAQEITTMFNMECLDLTAVGFDIAQTEYTYEGHKDLEDANVLWENMYPHNQYS